jgi:hypothetical protein
MTNADQYLSRYENGQGMVPGFTTSMKTRPLVVSKLVSYLHEKSVNSFKTIVRGIKNIYLETW